MYTQNIGPIILLSMPGGSEWIFIILAIILLFGGKKLPELARGLGKGMRDFKQAREGVEEGKEKETPDQDNREAAR